jgi:hypothetical protein
LSYKSRLREALAIGFSGEESALLIRDLEELKMTLRDESPLSSRKT